MRRPRRAPAPLRTPAPLWTRAERLTLRRRRRRPPGTALPRRRRGPPGPGSRPSPGANLRARVPPGREGSDLARSPHRPPTPDHPPAPARTPTRARLRGPQRLRDKGLVLRRGSPGQERAPGLELAPGQGRRRRRAPRHGPPRTPRSAWLGQARRIRAHRSRVLPGGVPPYPALRERTRPGRPAPNRAAPGAPQDRAPLDRAPQDPGLGNRRPRGRTPLAQAPQDRGPRERGPRDGRLRVRMMGVRVPLGQAARDLGRRMPIRRCRRGHRRLRLTCLLGLGRPVSGSRGICWRSRSAWAGWPWSTGPPMSGWDGGSR
jgi:hypothetical protein